MTAKRVAIRDAAPAIAERLPFRTYGSLRGDCPPEDAMTHHDLGRLDRDHGNRLMLDYLSKRLTFVVYSYATPIAWHRDDVGWYVPDERYSRTTSRHQSLVRQAVTA